MNGSNTIDLNTHIRPLLDLCQWASQAASFVESLGYLCDTSEAVSNAVKQSRIGFPELVDGDGSGKVADALEVVLALLSECQRQQGAANSVRPVL